MVENPGDIVKMHPWSDTSTGRVENTNTFTINTSQGHEIFVPATFDDAARHLAQEMADLIISKQNDYGKDNILESPAGPEVGLLVRMWDKFARLKNLITNNKKPNNETLDDTLIDIANYAILMMMIRKGWFELPLEESES